MVAWPFGIHAEKPFTLRRDTATIRVDVTFAAPDADFVIVKAVSEATAAHNGVPAEPACGANLLDALDWADRKMTELGQPAVGCAGLPPAPGGKAGRAPAAGPAPALDPSPLPRRPCGTG